MDGNHSVRTCISSSQFGQPYFRKSRGCWMREHRRHARSCLEPLDADGIIASGAAIEESISCLRRCPDLGPDKEQKRVTPACDQSHSCQNASKSLPTLPEHTYYVDCPFLVRVAKYAETFQGQDLGRATDVNTSCFI